MFIAMYGDRHQESVSLTFLNQLLKMFSVGFDAADEMLTPWPYRVNNLLIIDTPVLSFHTETMRSCSLLRLLIGC